MRNTIDEDYAVVAARRDRPQRPRMRLAAVVVVAVFGSLVALSAAQTRANEPSAARERNGLIDQIHSAQAGIADQQAQIKTLTRQINALQGTVGGGASGADLLAALRTAKVLAGVGPVTGPGVRIVVASAPAGAGNEGVIRDSDLQLLVNGLWQAGAEAIAINGNRIDPLTAIRTAGQAITVNYRSLIPPYTVSAIGNPDTLQGQFANTTAGQTWLDLETNFGMRFDMSNHDSLSLPGSPPLRVRYAHDRGVAP